MEDTRELDDSDGYERDTFNGYSRSELYIDPTYKDLKEEVVSSTTASKNGYYI